MLKISCWNTYKNKIESFCTIYHLLKIYRQMGKNIFEITLTCHVMKKGVKREKKCKKRLFLHCFIIPQKSAKLMQKIFLSLKRRKLYFLAYSDPHEPLKIHQDLNFFKSQWLFEILFVKNALLWIYNFFFFYVEAKRKCWLACFKFADSCLNMFIIPRRPKKMKPQLGAIDIDAGNQKKRMGLNFLVYAHHTISGLCRLFCGTMLF